jgi:hemoglobin/transferrin/lactoferrin receptor protein
MTMRLRAPGALLAGVSGVALLVAGSAAAQAQTAQNASVQNIQMLDAITVAATKTEEKAIDSLSAVSVLQQSDIDSIGPRRVEDLFFMIPGVWTQERGDTPEASVNIRGMQDFGRVAVVIDGARQNFQRSGHNANGTFLIDPELLSSVDIVRGPVANIYGSGAIGGVASFQTKDVDDILRPGERWGGQVHTAFGSNPGYPVTSAFGAARAANVEAIVGGSYRTTGNYKDGHGDPVENSGYDLASGLAKVTVRPADGHKIKLTGITEKSDYNTGQATGLPPGTQAESIYKTRLSTDIVSARWTYARPEDRLFDFDGNVYWSGTKQDQTKTRGAASPITGAVGDARSFSIDTAGFDVHNTSRFDTGPVRHALTYGGDLFRDTVENIDGTGNGAVTTPNGDRTVSGAFVQWKANYATWLEFIGALRYDSYELNGGGTHAEGDHLSPKATLGITPWQGITFYGTFAEGYRAPAVTETLVSGAHPPFAPGFADLFTFVPNPNLRPEIGKTKEVGINLKYDSLFQAGDALRGKVNLFRNDVDDYIELVTFGPQFCLIPGLPLGFCPGALISPYSFAQYQNVEHARIQGVELEATYDRGDWFAQVAGHHMTGKDVDRDIPLASVPPDKLTLGFGMRFFDRKFTTMVRWIGVAAKKAGDIPDRDGDGSPDALPTGGYGIVNLYFSYQPNPDVQIDFSVDNVFDRYYVPYLAEASNRAFAGPGINFKGGLKIRFGDSFYKSAKQG